MRADRRLILLPLLLLLGAAAAEQPAPQTTPRWTARHQQKLQALRGADPQIIFVGDSITEELENTNPRFGDINAVWRRFYACRNPLNLGFAGDTTGNALWRLQNGEIAGIHPKLAVVLIGTNDISLRGAATPQDAAAGVRAVVQTLHGQLPRTRILVLGLLPREKFERSRVAVNDLLGQMDWSALNARFVALDSMLDSGTGPDPALYRETALGRPLLHPNKAGWQKIATAIEPQVAAALGDHRALLPGGGVCPAG